MLKNFTTKMYSAEKIMAINSETGKPQEGLVRKFTVFGVFSPFSLISYSLTGLLPNIKRALICLLLDRPLNIHVAMDDIVNHYAGIHDKCQHAPREDKKLTDPKQISFLRDTLGKLANKWDKHSGLITTNTAKSSNRYHW